MDEPSRAGVCEMFDAISPTYDRVNRILSFGIDRYWRKKMADFVSGQENVFLLDCATGTGDQIFSLMDHSSTVSSAVGIDFAAHMLEIAKEKTAKKSYRHKVSFRQASATAIPYPENTFDCATISFGIRNVADVPLCLSEILRVLKPGGKLLILEFSMPQNALIKSGHLFYLRHLLPFVGGWISKNKKAYSYLNQTIETFPSGKDFLELLKSAGFVAPRACPLTFGISTIYEGHKP